ncbi:MAG TPA: serine hydrolase domain-containing protein [Candidatus Limnocylindrales bacterium]|nr:serine hydrolase domain-containing protein [Candidatus Limnocylindrales bacterium]
MARPPDPRQAPPPAGADRHARDARGRWSTFASRLVAILLVVLLTGWASLALALATNISGDLVVAVAAGSTPAPASGEPSPAASADPSAAASAEPAAPAGSPGAEPSPEASPTSPPAATPGEPAARPRVTTRPVRDRLDAELDAVRQRLGIPGVSATIIFRDGTSWTGTSGVADVARGVEVAEDTAFALGSVSKTYTAALILALAREKLVDLDAPAADYVAPRPLDRRITVRMLLNHTSGLDDYFLHATIDRALQAEPATPWSIKRTLNFVSKPYFPPGTNWRYSNTNYLYLGLIAEDVTGSPLGSALHDRFFGPLGLDGTWYQGAEDPRAPTAHGYRFVGTARSAKPIDLSDGSAIMPFTSVITASAGAGSVAATSSDAARWARLLYTGGVLGSDMTALMLDGVAATRGYAPRVPYGLGVQAFSIDGRPTVGHSGRLLGFRSAVRHLPGEMTTIAVLTNQSRADPGVIVRDLLSVVFAPEPPCLRCQDPT